MSVFRNCSLNASRNLAQLQPHCSLNCSPHCSLNCSLLAASMCDPNKIFIGKLHRWVERDYLLHWMYGKAPGLCPMDIFVLDPPNETALRSAFVTYRRAPHNSPGSLH